MSIMNNRIAVAFFLTVSFGCAVHAQTPVSKFELPKNLPRILNKLQTHLDQARTVVSLRVPKTYAERLAAVRK
jgi:hypothetical protein